MSRKNVLVLSTKIMSIVTATCAVCISQSVSAETKLILMTQKRLIEVC